MNASCGMLATQPKAELLKSFLRKLISTCGTGQLSPRSKSFRLGNSMELIHWLSSELPVSC